MTPEEFAEKMKELNEIANGDPEAGHVDADDLMCKLLEALGYKEGVEIFRKMSKWYA